MKAAAQIATLIREIAHTGKPHLIQGIVESVNSNGTFNVAIEDDLIIPGVRVNVISGSGTGLELTPKKGSPVIIGVVDSGQDHQLIQATEITRMRCRVGNTIFVMTQDGVTINEGKLNGLVKVTELTQKLNELENKYNTLLTALNAITIPLAPTGAVPLAPFLASAQQITPTLQADIENTKVKQ